jgi:uncharacterized phosphatase
VRDDAVAGTWVEVGATAVCLVRHGETDWNALGRLQGREDVPLNDRGREQARRSGEALRRYAWDHVLTSPLARARETATIIAAQVGAATVHEVPELVERDYGAASGLTRAEAALRFPDGVVPGEEDCQAVRARCLPVVERWARRHPGGRLLVVTHDGVISALLAAASGGALTLLGGALRNACLNLLEHHAVHGWSVVAYNVVDHLGDPAGTEGGPPSVPAARGTPVAGAPPDRT